MNELYIKEVQGKGRGVFSKKDIKTGEIVEISPVVIFAYTTTTKTSEEKIWVNNECILVRTIVEKKEMPDEIDNIVFSWSYLTGNKKEESCIALGYGSLFNSANPSNMRYEADKNNNIIFIAVVDIPKDTELTINYSGIGGSHIANENYWFIDKGIKFN